ncbi:MAG TPA: phosphatase PAP2 family protein, partial [Rhodanobacter sp.]
MRTLPPLHTPELLAGSSRLALDRRVCVAANRWGARRAVGLFFGTVSRLGDGIFWYALMAVLVLLGGQRGLLAAAQMAVTGLAALLL